MHFLHYRFVTDDNKSSAAEVPECFKASATTMRRTDVLSEEDLKELEKSASLISKSSISEKKLLPNAKGSCIQQYIEYTGDCGIFAPGKQKQSIPYLEYQVA